MLGLTQWGVNLNNIHCVGHSLGAHVCGYAGKYLRRMNYSNPIQRISGLDPAGPLFVYSRPDDRLDKDDAYFVDVIHTCGRFIGLGFKQSIGDIDFFPNGGGWQAGCGYDIFGKCIF